MCGNLAHAHNYTNSSVPPICLTVFSDALQRCLYSQLSEQMLIFLHTIGHDVRFRVVGGRFRRSIETVHQYSRHVLRAILQSFKHMIRESDKDTPLEIRNSSRFNSYFKVNSKGFHFPFYFFYFLYIYNDIR